MPWRPNLPPVPFQIPTNDRSIPIINLQRVDIANSALPCLVLFNIHLGRATLFTPFLLFLHC